MRDAREGLPRQRRLPAGTPGTGAWSGCCPYSTRSATRCAPTPRSSSESPGERTRAERWDKRFVLSDISVPLDCCKIFFEWPSRNPGSLLLYEREQSTAVCLRYRQLQSKLTALCFSVLRRSRSQPSDLARSLPASANRRTTAESGARL